MPTGKKHSSKIKQAVVVEKLRDPSISVRALSRMFGVSPTSVQEILDQAKDLTPSDLDRVIRASDAETISAGSLIINEKLRHIIENGLTPNANLFEIVYAMQDAFKRKQLMDGRPTDISIGVTTYLPAKGAPQSQPIDI